MSEIAPKLKVMVFPFFGGVVQNGSNSAFAAKACQTTYHVASMRCVFDFASGTIFASVAAVFPRNAVSFSKPVCRLSQKSAVVPK